MLSSNFNAREAEIAKKINLHEQVQNKIEKFIYGEKLWGRIESTSSNTLNSSCNTREAEIVKNISLHANIRNVWGRSESTNVCRIRTSTAGDAEIGKNEVSQISETLRLRFKIMWGNGYLQLFENGSPKRID